jgi:hypothetical protein
MMRPEEFEKRIRDVTRFGEKVKLGRTAPILAALRAYHESKDANEAQAEQAAYLLQVVKNCRTWISQKAGTKGGSTKARRAVVKELQADAEYCLGQMPLVLFALGRYGDKKATGALNVPLTPLKEVYANEGLAYQQLKAQGQFVDPTQRRMVPSASLMGPKITTVSRKDPRIGGSPFRTLNFNDYMKLDTLLASQYRVLYMRKIQRLRYMVAVEDAMLFWADAGTPVDMPGSTVLVDLGQGRGKTASEGDRFERGTQLYACDRFGNLFVVANNLDDENGTKIQVNHSTMCAGKEVLCAGTISIKNGTLRAISNLSGHYQPNTDALTRMLTMLRDQGGVNVDQVVVMDMSPKKGTTTGARYLAQDYEELRRDPLVVNLLNAAV